MNFKKSVKNFFITGEKSLFERIGNYAQLGEQANDHLRTMLNCHNRIDLSVVKEKIKKLEVEGDSITFELKNNITSGAVNPSLTDSFLELVDRSDDILDTLYYISREIARFSEFLSEASSGEMNIICQYYEKINRALDYNSESLKDLQKMVSNDDVRNIIKYWSNIERMEEEVDDIKDELLDKLYSDSKKISYLSFIHLSSVIHKVDDLLDQNQDIADLLIQIITAVTS
jgi:predicted phosphate transport protein (TIGR00153 family)